MAIRSSDITQDIYQLKVTLLGTNPPIWRRILVPAGLTLAKLHNVLQITMGWDDEHMHEFRAGQRRFGRPEPADPFMRMSRVESERTVSLSAVLQKAGAKMIYTYDLGDSWEHSVLLEKRQEAEPHTIYPICIDGQLTCPPEDCGGIPGYYDLLDAVADPGHPRHEELCHWIGGKFNPDEFSSDKVNRLLSPARRRSKTSTS